MKKILIITMMFAGIATAHAQTGAGPNKWEENNTSYKRRPAPQENEYINTAMTADKKYITFSGLPDLKRGTMAVVTNVQGEVILQRRVGPSNNSMDIHWLQRGELYYITLLYKNKSKKGFVLHI